ncbi:MAG: serine/threonine-protein kinase [Mycobacteriales bacterium]
MERIADYTFIRSLGEGNHGEFFLAKPPARLRLDREFVAVKVLAGQTNEEAFRRTTRELRAFATARSPYLVTLFDAGQDGGRFFYSMEYFSVGSLAAPAQPLDRPQILRALAQASRAAHALHEAGVVHRGIKPENILLTDDGAKLSDLGLAQLLAPGQTVTGLGPIGSVEYIDPAILRGERASRASDIWSLGLTLHRALTGVSVYGQISTQDPLLAVRTVLTHEPQLAPGLAEADAAVIRSCIALNPADRPRTAEVLAERIEALLT